MAQTEEKSALTIGAVALNSSYWEYSDSQRLLNREHGSNPGLALGLSRSHGRWLYAGDLVYLAGSLAYVGQTNTGLAIATRTKQSVVDMALRAEYWPSAHNGLDYAVYAGTGYHYRERDIQPTRTADGAPVSGLFETYRWWFGFLGAKAVVHRSDKVRWMLDARLTRPINPSVTVDFKGRFDSARLSPGKRWGVRLALPWRYSMSQTTDLVVVPFLEKRTLGRSATTPLTRNGLPVGAVFEPRSENRSYGLQIGFSQRF